MTWTAADAAELDVLVDELTYCFDEHRQQCECCQPCAQLAAWQEHRRDCWKCRNSVRFHTDYYGAPCGLYLAHIAHGRDCKQCNPCPHLKTAISVTLEWRHKRELRSRAEELRSHQQARNEAA